MPTTGTPFDHPTLLRFVTAHSGASSYRLQTLSGGLESSVAVLDLTSPHTASSARVVVKKLEGLHRREVRAYEALEKSAPGMSPRLLSIDESPDATYLFIDWVESSCDWPWGDVGRAESLIAHLARLHASASPLAFAAGWDYDDSLRDSARQTLEFFRTLAGRREFERVLRRRRALETLVAELDQIRDWLRSDPHVAQCVIHGDAHPGNAIIDAESFEPRLFDWAKYRIGSPLEDLSSWLQSLGCWEPSAKARHDHLFRHYLRLRGLDPSLTREIRDHYWLAAASNVLAGALRYHLVVACEQSPGSAAHSTAIRLSADCMRIIYRAYLCWRSPRMRGPGLVKADAEQTSD